MDHLDRRAPQVHLPPVSRESRDRRVSVDLQDLKADPDIPVEMAFLARSALQESRAMPDTKDPLDRRAPRASKDLRVMPARTEDTANVHRARWKRATTPAVAAVETRAAARAEMVKEATPAARRSLPEAERLVEAVRPLIVVKHLARNLARQELYPIQPLLVSLVVPPVV